MAIPERFVIEVLIPQKNKKIQGEELTLSEFYVWLGVNVLIGSLKELPIAKIGGQWIQLRSSKVLHIE